MCVFRWFWVSASATTILSSVSITCDLFDRAGQGARSGDGPRGLGHHRHAATRVRLDLRDLITTTANYQTHCHNEFDLNKLETQICKHKFYTKLSEKFESKKFLNF